MEIDAVGTTPIVLPDDICGVLGIRSWNVKDTSRYLRSLFAGYEWTSAIQQSKTPTTLPGQHGFYAYPAPEPERWFTPMPRTPVKEPVKQR